MDEPAVRTFATWSPGRKIVAGLFALGALVLSAGAAFYLAGVLFLLLNKASPAQARWGSIVHYWKLYGDDPRLRKRLITAISVSGALQLALPSAMVLAARQRRSLHGDARFASAAEVMASGLTDSSEPGIFVGRYRGRDLHLPGQLSVMLSAPTRSGKGVSVVIPNLLNWPDSAVVLDIKGENYDITAGCRSARGQEVYAFSPFDHDARSHRWNPLTAVRSSPLHRVGDLLTIGQVFYANDGSGTASEGFFNDQARNLFLALGLLLLESPNLPRTIGEMLRQSSGKGQPLLDHLTDCISSRAGTSEALSDECRDALQRLLSNSDNTMASIVATFVAPLTLFADAIVDAATSWDDFRLENVRRRRMTVYVRIPPNRLAASRPLLDLFFSQLVNLNTQFLPSQDSAAPVQCLIVADEFAALGRVRAIVNAAPYLAGYGLRLLTVIQAMSQLDAIYGDRQARTFATNHGLQILFAPREQRDADEYSAMLGHYTARATSHGRSRSSGVLGDTSVSTNESDQRRDLLLPQEMKELGSERLVIILENCKPILAEKVRYHRDPAFKARLLAAPEVPRMDMALHLAKVHQRWRHADPELPPGKKKLDIEELASKLNKLPDLIKAPAGEAAEGLIDVVADTQAGPSAGGAIDAVADAEGVLIGETPLDRARQGDAQWSLS